jgi:hypothetical protein
MIEELPKVRDNVRLLIAEVLEIKILQFLQMVSPHNATELPDPIDDIT